MTIQLKKALGIHERRDMISKVVDHFDLFHPGLIREDILPKALDRLDDLDLFKVHLSSIINTEIIRMKLNERQS
ncbi:MAG: hypothetical protein O7D34_02125 [Ignavibacteria bacterium]|nr:hypothetical protein [Ignavibacteria bacterium]